MELKDTPRYCVECKHVSDFCRWCNRERKRVRSVVTKAWTWEGTTLDPDDERSAVTRRCTNVTYCGPEGKYWEPKVKLGFWAWLVEVAGSF